jgi:hypothetical protein
VEALKALEVEVEGEVEVEANSVVAVEAATLTIVMTTPGIVSRADLKLLLCQSRILSVLRHQCLLLELQFPDFP